MENKLLIYNLSYKYEDTFILKNISFSLSSGDLLIVKGLNGSGKSTLLSLLSGFISLDNGAIYWNTTNINKTQEYLLAFQHQLTFCNTTNLLNFNYTIKENIFFWTGYSGYKTNINEIIFDNRLNLLFSKIIFNLSSGQRKKIHLSQSLFNYSPIWILDEPFIVLDKLSRILLLKQIEYARTLGAIIIIATHVDLNITNVKYLHL